MIYVVRYDSDWDRVTIDTDPPQDEHVTITRRAVAGMDKDVLRKDITERAEHVWRNRMPDRVVNAAIAMLATPEATERR